jgi:hypothetical protein
MQIWITFIIGRWGRRQALLPRAPDTLGIPLLIAVLMRRKENTQTINQSFHQHAMLHMRLNSSAVYQLNCMLFPTGFTIIYFVNLLNS